MKTQIEQDSIMIVVVVAFIAGALVASVTICLIAMAVKFL